MKYLACFLLTVVTDPVFLLHHPVGTIFDSQQPMARFLWPADVMVSVLACNSWGHKFNSRPFRCQVTTLGGQVVHTCASVTKKYNFLPVMGHRCPATGKVIVGLVSHWPCVTDLSGYSPTGSRPE